MVRRFTRAGLLATVSLFVIKVALANPQGGEVTAGDVAIRDLAPGRLVVEQTTNKAIINWRSFSIGAGESTTFRQPSAEAVALNRVRGDQVSQILGTLSANGRVFLVNPNGIVFGKDSKVDVSGLVASTHDITDKNFLAGRLRFDISGRPDARIMNKGLITAREGGLVALVAPGVGNSGVIHARLGKVELASADGFTVDLFGDDLIVFETGDEIARNLTDVNGNSLAALIEQAGDILADGGFVQLTANTARDVIDNAINMDGFIQASSIEDKGGTIVLSGGRSGLVEVTGDLDASSKNGDGGRIDVLGDLVALHSEIEVDATGATGGGIVRIGGDKQGKGETPTATGTFVGTDVTVRADATNNGDGGTVIVWADDITRYYGHISVTGGSSGGDGGFVEVSGKDYLEFRGTTDRSAALGLWGTLLLDPRNLTIEGGSGTNSGITFDSGTFQSTDDNAVLYAESIETELLNGNVIVETGGDGAQDGNLTVVGAIEPGSTVTADLTLRAHNDLRIAYNGTVDYNMNSARGNISLIADSDGNNSGDFIIEDDDSGWVRVVGLDDIYIQGADAVINDIVATSGGNITVDRSSLGSIGLAAAAGDMTLDSNELNRLSAIRLNIGGSTVQSRATHIDVRGVGNTTFANVSELVGLYALGAGGDGNVSFNAAASDIGRDLNVFARNDVVINTDVTTTNVTDSSTFVADADTDGSGDFIITSSGSLEHSSGNLNIRSVDVDIQGALTLTGSEAEIIIDRRSPGDIRVGDVSDAVGVMVVDNDELALISAEELCIGDTNTQDIEVNGVTAAATANIDYLDLEASAAGGIVVFETAASIFSGSLDVVAYTDIEVEVDITTNGITIFDADDDDSDAEIGIFSVDPGVTIKTNNNDLAIFAGDMDLQGNLDAGTAGIAFGQSQDSTIGIGQAAGQTLTISNAELARVTGGSMVVLASSHITIDGVARTDVDGISNDISFGPDDDIADRFEDPVDVVDVTFSGNASEFDQAVNVFADNDINVNVGMSAHGILDFVADFDCDIDGDFNV
ncbi:MAG: filamentous hemagglutinin N-terminal domain-containing protein, partial [Pseudomonadota bacterium]|nr:filamentous hemagglutinin N-terminal domain-containing protein [Pseudomonadota bacterium]